MQLHVNYVVWIIGVSGLVIVPFEIGVEEILRLDELDTQLLARE
jgi:hypothetical protein